MNEGYISVRNWRRFQHYDPAVRVPPWIKIYTELHSDESWLDLSSRRRGLLVDVWIEYSLSRGRIRLDTARLSGRFGYRVTVADIEALVDAGFLTIVASAALAEGYQDASAMLASRAPARSQDVEVEVEERKTSVVDGPRNVSADNGETTLDLHTTPETELDYERMLREMPG